MRLRSARPVNAASDRFTADRLPSAVLRASHTSEVRELPMSCTNSNAFSPSNAPGGVAASSGLAISSFVSRRLSWRPIRCRGRSGVGGQGRGSEDGNAGGTTKPGVDGELPLRKSMSSPRESWPAGGGAGARVRVRLRAPPRAAPLPFPAAPRTLQPDDADAQAAGCAGHQRAHRRVHREPGVGWRRRRAQHRATAAKRCLRRAAAANAPTARPLVHRVAGKPIRGCP